jgi:gliding motility-associated-like protein
LRLGPVHKKILLGAILATTVCTLSRGQITSATANRRDSLSYPVSEGRDPLFIFFQTNQVHKPGSLTATLPGSEDYNFQWSRYDPAIPGFGAPFSSDAGVPVSTVSDLQEGGYRVRIFNGGGTDTTLTAWVMLDDFRAWIDKTDDNKVKPPMYVCHYLIVPGFVTRDTLTYYDPVSNDALSTVIDFHFKWTSDNEDLRIPYDTLLLRHITHLPPTKDTWYILTATDDLGMVEVDSVLYESIETRARFKVEYYDKVLGIYDESLTGSWSKDQGSLDARLTVRFINESENGNSFEWVFLDTLGGIRQTETTYDTAEMAEYTYERADEYYYPYLVSTSEAGCTDTFRLEAAIFVEPSQLVIPNVFTPNGDGLNDIFIFKHQSLKTCRVTIVDRWGKVVYKKEIDDIYSWEGWDGNLHESDRRAPEGQYYFVVEATGYDGVEYSDPTIWETMKIFGGPGKDKTGGTSGTGGTTPGGTGPEGGSGNLYTGWLYLFRH